MFRLSHSLLSPAPPVCELSTQVLVGAHAVLATGDGIALVGGGVGRKRSLPPWLHRLFCTLIGAGGGPCRARQLRGDRACDGGSSCKQFQAHHHNYRVCFVNAQVLKWRACRARQQQRDRASGWWRRSVISLSHHHGHTVCFVYAQVQVGAHAILANDGVMRLCAPI